MSTGIKRTYSDFVGVDFLNQENLVDIKRSPDALNVWKNYQELNSMCIQTRPGYRKLCEIGSKINGIYIYSSTKAIVHSGQKLYQWSNFPDEPTNETLTTLYSSMENKESKFVVLGTLLYIKDSNNYLVYNGSTVSKVSTNSYIPTTRIGMKPTGGGEKYEDINLLQPKMKNSFCGDGTSTIYQLNATNIDATPVTITVDEVTKTESTDFTVDRTNGKITFTTAPSSPALSDDNVIITFSKTTQGYEDIINKCTIMVVYDNRLFFAGNPDYPNRVYNSKLDTPNYISDVSYISCGENNSIIKCLLVGNDVLWVLKNNNQGSSNIFYLEPSIDLENGKIYPNKQGNANLGCYSTGINFKDDIVFLSRSGLEGITTNDIDTKQVLEHRSSLIDSKMISLNGYSNAKMLEWRGYLLILVNGKIFLADSRSKFTYQKGIEYNWFYWDISASNPNVLIEYENNLYIGSTDGSIFIFDGTNDNDNAIVSYWTTPMDNFGYNNKQKTTNKNGGIAQIKTIPNGKIKIGKRTNKSDSYIFTIEKSASGFNFTNINFGNFSFVTTSKSPLMYKIKEKKINEISLKFYSDEKDKPFGLISATIEAFVGGYIKK